MKDFDNWNKQKKAINSSQSMPTFQEREIWWCKLGVNIGHEEDGKGTQLQRPILIITKFNHRLCWAVPLTTQIKDNKHYHYFEFLNKPQCGLLTQMKLIDAVRLNKKMGRLGKQEFNRIRDKLKLYLS
jgi:mRNA interferase MazF